MANSGVLGSVAVVQFECSSIIVHMRETELCRTDLNHACMLFEQGVNNNISL